MTVVTLVYKFFVEEDVRVVVKATATLKGATMILVHPVVHRLAHRLVHKLDHKVDRGVVVKAAATL